MLMLLVWNHPLRTTDLEQCLSSLYEYLEFFLNSDFDLVSLGWIPRVYSSNKLPGDAG